MSSSVSTAEVLINALMEEGVRRFVVSPGSRSAPLTLAVMARTSDVDVRIDERAASFLALGRGKASGAPAVLVCSSGTAVANYHPAVLEADQSGTPLIVLTADRPPELHGRGANQTITQNGLYGAAVRFHADVPIDRWEAAAVDDAATRNRAVQTDVSELRRLVHRAVTASLGIVPSLSEPACVSSHTGGAPAGWPGPVHLNVPLRDPLTPSPGELSTLRAPPSGPYLSHHDQEATAIPYVLSTKHPSAASARLKPSPSSSVTQVVDRVHRSDRVLVVAGEAATGPDDDRSPAGADAGAFLRDTGWPVIAEPTSGLRHVATPNGEWLAGCEPFLVGHTPDVIITLGRPVLTRSVGQLLHRAKTIVSCDPLGHGWDPYDCVTDVVATSLTSLMAPAYDTSRFDDQPVGGRSFGDRWRNAGLAVDDVITHDLEHYPEPSGLRTARDVASTLYHADAASTLVVGSSLPIRHLNQAMPPIDLRVIGNRGVSGIDGFTSTAFGVAREQRSAPTVAMTGDLSFLHDLGGLIVGPIEPVPTLPIVVTNNDGGGIFDLLEYRTSGVQASVYERVFSTPHGRDLEAITTALGHHHVAVDDLPRQLLDALDHPGVTVLEIETDRRTELARHRRISEAVVDRLVQDHTQWNRQ